MKNLCFIILMGIIKVPFLDLNQTAKAQQEPILIADVNFFLEGALTTGLRLVNDDPKDDKSGTDYYYAFESGDILSIDFSMANAKGTNAISITMYPENIVKYSNLSFTEFSDLRIKIDKRSIYKISIATNHAMPRNCKMKIKRIPDSEERIKFNPIVIWQKKYEAVQVQKVQEFYINSGSNAAVKGGKSRILLPVKFPPNTVEWYYTFSSYRNADEIKRVSSGFNTLSQLVKLLGSSGGALSFGINQFTQPGGGNICDLYILNHENSNPFENKQAFSYFTEGTRKNCKSAIVRIQENHGQFIYIGIINPDSFYGIHVAIEVVAITVTEDFVMQNP